VQLGVAEITATSTLFPCSSPCRLLFVPQTNVYVLGTTFLKFRRLLSLQLPVLDPSLCVSFGFVLGCGRDHVLLVSPSLCGAVLGWLDGLLRFQVHSPLCGKGA